ncbi:MAG: hypothetical protein CVU39_20435 [Chloroflexi bacterium HGW-Chloroflexi-10]|nr:MAG: hypothetical protein CVU39_20435 [Chloroflexi bacterium HGW-Chloroflexi-10]
MKIFKSLFHTSTLLLLLVLVSACSNNVPLQTPTEPTMDVNIAIVEETESVIKPTQTSTPLKFVVFTQNLENYDPAGQISAEIETYAIINNLIFEKMEFSPDLDFSQISRALIFHPSDDVLQNIQNKAETTFIIITEKDIQPSDHLIVLKEEPANIVFMAGYIGEVVAEDWRLGGLLPQINFQNTPANTVFYNGGKYFCGLCAPIYAPVVFFPVTANLSNSGDPNTAENAFTEISNNYLNALFVPSAYLNDIFATNLKQNGILILSDLSESHPLYDFVDISIFFDYRASIQSVLDNHTGSTAGVHPVNIQISSPTGKLTSGKAEVVQDVLQDLIDGYISPYTVSE